MSLTADERETIVDMCDGDDIAYVYTAQRPVITKLRKNPSAELIEEGTHSGTPWARFRLPAGLVSFRNARRKTQISDERRKQLADNAKRARNAKG